MVNVNERKKTRKFYNMLEKRSREAKEHPEKLVPLERLSGKQSKTTSHS